MQYNHVLNSSQNVNACFAVLSPMQYTRRVAYVSVFHTYTPRSDVATEGSSYPLFYFFCTTSLLC